MTTTTRPPPPPRARGGEGGRLHSDDDDDDDDDRESCLGVDWPRNTHRLRRVRAPDIICRRSRRSSLIITTRSRSVTGSWPALRLPSPRADPVALAGPRFRGGRRGGVQFALRLLPPRADPVALAEPRF